MPAVPAESLPDDGSHLQYLRPAIAPDYKKATPPWVKVRTKLLHDDVYLSLNPLQRSALLGLEMLYALRGTSPPLDVRFLNRQMHMSTKLQTWKALADSGFVEILDAPESLEERERQRRDT
jgi:hypothetical protein